MTLVDRTKELLSDPKLRILLHDLVTEKTREAISLTGDDHFPLGGSWDVEEFAKRLSDYEQIAGDLVSMAALLGNWGTDNHLDIMTLPAKRIGERIQPGSGLNVWLALRWYPLLLFTYSLGIASVASNNYRILSEFFRARIPDQRSGGELALILAVLSSLSDLSDAFKKLPGHEKQHVPHSEYIYKTLQPRLDDLLFLGAEYEHLFDRFEILLALEHAHQHSRQGHSPWGPIGRFGWKHFRGHGSPFADLVQEAELAGHNWTPIAGGFFDGSYERFQEIAAAFTERLQRLVWY
jgi:hypothetical protein